VGLRVLEAVRGCWAEKNMWRGSVRPQEHCCMRIARSRLLERSTELDV